MNSEKYIDMDVHQATLSAAVLDSAGKLVMESILETKAATILQFIDGLRGSLSVTFEEGTCAAWLYDLLKPRVTKVVVCDPRKNALLKAGNKSDRIDARKLAELLRTGLLSPVYHGEAGVRTLKELARSYLTITKDLTRVMSRLKALYQSWAIPCAGQQVYAPRHRAEWLGKLSEAGVRRRAVRLYHQLDLLQSLRQEARRELLAESRNHPATRWLRKIPYLGPVRVAVLIALLQTPHRFRTKRQLWAYSGLALETHTSADYRFVDGQLRRSRKPLAIRGLNQNHNHDSKHLFKSAATTASARPGPFRDFYAAWLKALYRTWAIPCAGTLVYAPCYRANWLEKVPQAGARRRAGRLYQQLDLLQFLRKEARRELLAESRKHRATRLLRGIPCIGPIRAALLVALMQTPHRFRTKRQLWAYSGLALETRTSGEYRFVEGQLRRSKKLLAIFGLNENHNHDLKNIFKGAATGASACAGPFRDFYEALLAKGMKPTMARLTLARKIAAITLSLWKKGACFDAEELKRQAA